MAKPKKYDEVKDFLDNRGQIDMLGELPDGWAEAINYLLWETRKANDPTFTATAPGVQEVPEELAQIPIAAPGQSITPPDLPLPLPSPESSD